MPKPLEFAIRARDRFSATFTKLEKRVEGIRGKMQKAFGSRLGMAAMVTTITAGYGTIIKSAIEFEAALANVSTLVDTNTVSMKAFEEQIVDMAPKVQKSTTELANGLYQVVSAGIDTAKAMDVVNVAARAGVAGLTDTFTAVDIITTGLNAYGKSAEEAEQVSDVLFQTVKLGKTTFGELANFLGPVLPMANTLGISLEEVGAAMSTMTAAGLRTDISATALRATLSSLIQNASKFRDIGIDVIKVAGEEGLTGVMNRLKEATGGDIEAIQKLMPNVRALAAVLTITGSGAEKFTRDLKEMRDAAGSTEEAFQKQSVTTKAAWNEMKANFSAFAASVGEGLLPIVRAILKFGSWVLKFIRVSFSNIGILVAEFWTIDTFKIIPEVLAATFKAAFKVSATILVGMFKTLLDMTSAGMRLLVSAFTGGDTSFEHIGNAMRDGIKETFLAVGKTIEDEFAGVSKKIGVKFDNLTEDLDMSLIEESGKKIGESLGEGIKQGVESVGEKTQEKVLEISSVLEAKMAEWAMNVEPISIRVGDLITGTFDMIAERTGEAVANTIVDGENLGQAMKKLFKDVAKNVIKQLIAIGVQRLILAGVTRAMGIQQFASEAAQGAAAVYVNSFKSAAAIPVIGWSIAPGIAAANSALAISGMSGSFGAGMGAAMGLAGKAHAGLTNVPAEGTFLLQRGERVVQPEQNRDLTDFLSEEGGGGGVNINMSILPNATNAEAMLQMTKEDWDDVYTEKILPAMRRASERGAAR